MCYQLGVGNIIDGWWEVVLAICAIYRHIVADRCNQNYGLHGVLYVTIHGISGVRDAVASATGKSAAVFLRNLSSAHSRCCRHSGEDGTKGRLNNDMANGKGQVRSECAAALQFMRTRRWEALLTICLEEGVMNNKRV